MVLKEAENGRSRQAIGSWTHTSIPYASPASLRLRGFSQGSFGSKCEPLWSVAEVRGVEEEVKDRAGSDDRSDYRMSQADLNGQTWSNHMALSVRGHEVNMVTGFLCYVWW